MACLALSLQPLNGADVLLQTREWFPPARAALASHSFRTTRLNPTGGKSDLTDQQPMGLGSDPISAASGQVVVGKESKYRVIYRLVNSIYVLGITTADQDVSSNVFECTSTVNQAVSVLLAACKGIDVTSDKVLRKYTEVYMALDVVLRGVSTARLATILASFHGDGITQIVVSATDTAENRARGAESWNQLKGHSVERLNHIEVLSNTTFELPEEALAAGDEAAALLATPAQASAPFGANIPEKVEEKSPESEDPFAASERINKPEELLTGSGFKKDKEVSNDVTAGLSELTVVPVDTGTTTIKGVEGFEGDYGSLDYDPADGGFGDAFEGLTDAFGGGLDPAEFGAVTEKQRKLDAGLGGLEELEGGGGKKATPESAENEGGTKPAEANGVPSHGPVVWLTEEISAEYRGADLTRVGLQGSLLLKTIPPSVSKEDTEFSFGLEGTDVIQRAVVRNNVASNLGESLYHVRTPPSDAPITILQYRLHPKFTPIPLRLRLVSRQNPLTLSFMIQYAPNPYLRGILTDVAFIVSLPFAPSTLKLAPRGIFDRSSMELRWVVPQLLVDGSIKYVSKQLSQSGFERHVGRLPQAIPQRLRAQLPLAPEFVTSNQEDGQHSKEKEVQLKFRVEFKCQGQSLSGISVIPASKDTSPQFSVGQHFFRSRKFLCS